MVTLISIILIIALIIGLFKLLGSGLGCLLKLITSLLPLIGIIAIVLFLLGILHF